MVNMTKYYKTCDKHIKFTTKISNMTNKYFGSNDYKTMSGRTMSCMI